MTEDTTVRDTREDVDLVEIVRQLMAGKWWIAGFASIGLLAAVLYLHIATREYRTQLQVTPAASSAGGKSQLGGLSGLAAIAGVSLGDSSQGVTPFDLYLETLNSRALAASLAKDPVVMRSAFKEEWDAKAKRWSEPRSPVRVVTKSIRSILGIPRPAWHPPGPPELQEFIRRHVVVEKPDAKDAPITKIILDSEEPEFAAHLLVRMNEIADDRVRRTNLATARSYAIYLSQKLRSEMVAEYRRDLSQALGEQEKSIMLASSKEPYAATTIEPPITASLPVHPNGPFILLLGLAVGMMVGSAVALTNFKALRSRLR